MTNYEKVLIVKSKLDSCHDYRMLDKYIEIIRNVANEYPHPEFERMLKYAQKRRDSEFIKFIATLDLYW